MAASKRGNYPNTPQRPKVYFAKCGFVEVAILYIFGHIPKNAYAILASPFKQGCRMPLKHRIREASKASNPRGVGSVESVESERCRKC